jgi:hypothetical protein
MSLWTSSLMWLLPNRTHRSMPEHRLFRYSTLGEGYSLTPNTFDLPSTLPKRSFPNSSAREYPLSTILTTAPTCHIIWMSWMWTSSASIGARISPRRGKVSGSRRLSRATWTPPSSLHLRSRSGKELIVSWMRRARNQDTFSIWVTAFFLKHRWKTPLPW